MAPVVDGLHDDFSDTVQFRIYNAEESEGGEIARDLGVTLVPTFVFVDGNGNEVDRVVGSMSEDALRQRLEALEP